MCFFGRVTCKCVRGHVSVPVRTPVVVEVVDDDGAWRGGYFGVECR